MGHSEPAEHEAVHDEGAANALVILLVALAIGIVCRNVLKRTKIPYTVLLLMFGLLLGTVHQNSDGGMGTLGHSIDSWASISPHTILYTLLPLLIFESSFSCDVHIFMRELTQVLMLAGPGVLLSTLLTGLVCKGMMYSDWDWSTSLMFGAMMSATDPVAVVALLKELGVSKRLGTLIEGESLLNDGTSIVVFTVFKDAVTGETSRGAGDVVAFFLQLSFGGPVVGLAVGAAASFLLGYILNDAMSEITVTILACFTAFVLGEHTFGVSGVLAVVATGLVLSYVGRTRISATVEEALHSFWEVAGYVANSLVFVLAGLISAEKAISADIDASDWGLLILLYVMLHLIRALMLVLFAPFLRRRGYGLSWQQGCVLCYGGLRGAVGLTLALIVEEDERVPLEVRERVLFHMGGIGILTLLVNGTSMSYVLQKLGLAARSAEKETIFRHACNAIAEGTEQAAADMVRADRFLDDADWSLVWRYLPVHTSRAYRRRINKGLLKGHIDDLPYRLRNRWRRYEATFSGADKTLTSTASFREGEEAAEDEDRDQCMITLVDDTGKERVMTYSRHDRFLVEERHRFLSAIKAVYWRLSEEGSMSPSSLHVLLEAANRQLDRETNEGVGEWEQVERLLASRVAAFGQKYQVRKLFSIPLLGHTLKYLLHRRISFCFDVATNFIKAHEQVDVEALLSNRDDAAILLGEVAANVRAAERLIRAQLETFPEIARAIKTKLAARVVLGRERHAIENLHHHGHIEEDEYDALIKENTTSLVKLEYHPPAMRIPDRYELLANVGFLRGVPPELFHKVVKEASEVFFSRNEALMEQGDPPNGWYVVARGSCRICHRVDSADAAQEGSLSRATTLPDDVEGEVTINMLGPGHTIGVLGTLANTPRRATVRSNDIVQAFFFDGPTIMRFMAASPALETSVWRAAGIFVAETFLPEFQRRGSVHIRNSLADATLLRAAPMDEAGAGAADGSGASGEEVAIPLHDGKAILMHGRLVRVGTERLPQPIWQFAVLRPSGDDMFFSRDAVLLHIHETNARRLSVRNTDLFSDIRAMRASSIGSGPAPVTVGAGVDCVADTPREPELRPYSSRSNTVLQQMKHLAGIRKAASSRHIELEERSPVPRLSGAGAGGGRGSRPGSVASVASVAEEKV